MTIREWIKQTLAFGLMFFGMIALLCIGGD
jgi:hypothetical protein